MGPKRASEEKQANRLRREATKKIKNVKYSEYNRENTSKSNNYDVFLETLMFFYHFLKIVFFLI